MSSMVNLGIGFQSKSLFCSSTPQHGGYTNSSLLEGDVKVRKCHAMILLRNCMILTIRFKITAEIEITKHMFCVLLCRRGRVSAF